MMRVSHRAIINRRVKAKELWHRNSWQCSRDFFVYTGLKYNFTMVEYCKVCVVKHSKQHNTLVQCGLLQNQEWCFSSALHITVQLCVHCCITMKKVALLLTYPPHRNSTTRQNQPICNLPLSIAITFEQIRQFPNCFGFTMNKKEGNIFLNFSFLA